MKKSTLVLLTFVPVIVGYIINLTILLPVIGPLFFYVMPIFATVFWFYLGRQFAHTAWKTIPAILIGNATGIVSLLLYLWQFLLKTDETRNLTVAAISQMFPASAPYYLLAKIAILFEKEPNTIGPTATNALQVLSFGYMFVVFCVAILWEKNRIKKASDQ